jgi:nucleotide-binding universal stress UspA family protein
MFKPKSILVPTDFSEYSELAFKQAVEIAQIAGAKITLLHVQSADLDNITSLYLSKEQLKEIHDRLNKEINDNLDKMINSIDDLGNAKVEKHHKIGVPYDEIVNLTKKKKYDLLVISSHGKNALQTFLYGSTTEKVVRNAHCSVLVVRK